MSDYLQTNALIAQGIGAFFAHTHKNGNNPLLIVQTDAGMGELAPPVPIALVYPPHAH